MATIHIFIDHNNRLNDLDLAIDMLAYKILPPPKIGNKVAGVFIGSSPAR